MRRHPAITIHRGASRDDIKEFVGCIRRRLPKSYSSFLTECGWADINGDIVYGLGPDVTDRESVLEQSVNEATRARPPMAYYLVPLMPDGAGNHDCLDTRKVKDGDCPVVLWDHEHSRGEIQSPKLVSRSFTAWLARKVREAPEF
ncbi:MAG: SMI1/KNR4 family protein [Fimbriimonadaceae bacterium]|nr:SMI1/KNR4 family protein [Fimbriimonadaceae bacterium]